MARRQLGLLQAMPAGSKLADRFAVLLADIIETANAGHPVHARQEDVAELMGCSSRTVSRATRRMHGAGALSVGEHATDWGQRAPNSYAQLVALPVGLETPAENLNDGAPDKMSWRPVTVSEQQKEIREEAVEAQAAPVDNPDAELPAVQAELAAAFSSSSSPENESGALEAARGGVYGEELAQVKERWGESRERDVAEVLHTRASKALSRPVVLAAFAALFSAKKVDIPGAYFRDMLKRSSGGTLGARAAPSGPGLRKVAPRPAPAPDIPYEPRHASSRTPRFEAFLRERQLL